jgi:hypothetical protein
MSLTQPFLRPLLILALLFTLLNAFKPLCIDDTLYQYHAQQLADHFFNPYGFRIYWNERPEPAVQVLAPVMMSYWWALGIKLFGEHPFLWKLWLLPYALLLVFSLHALLRRFAPGHEMILTCMTIISPVFLPSFNLMLDVPVAALILCALAVFLRASDRDSLSLAALAGLIGGIAAQTKYNGLIAPAVMLLYALIFRKARFGVLAALVSGVVFLLWEGFIVLRVGQSAFLAQSRTYGGVHLLAKYAYLAWPLVTIMGAVAPAVALLALVALGARGRTIVLGAALFLLGYLALAFAPQRLQIFTRDLQTSQERLTLALLIFSVFGLVFFAALAAVIWRLTTSNGNASKAISHWRNLTTEWFLVGWLVIETVAYFGLSPIPAVRRVLGLLVVSALLIGRLASRTSINRKPLIRRVAFAGMLLGLIFYAVDFRDAYVEKVAVEKTVQKISDLSSQLHANSGSTAWYVARWGFQYYAERAGMKPVVADESDFQPGDWLAISDSPHWPKPVAEHIKRYSLEPVTELVVADRWPLATMMGYYSTGIPMHHQTGPRRLVRIYRVTGRLP